MTDIIVLNDFAIDSELLIACVGYEERSVYYSGLDEYSSHEKIFLFDYQAHGLYSYDRNVDLAKGLTNQIYSDFSILLQNIKSELESREYTSVEFDVTSFDRNKIGKLLVFLFQNASLIKNIQLVYCPSSYVEPQFSFEVVNSFGPVLPMFMGASSTPKERLSLIVGAGYEFGKVIGAIDSLEPDSVHCFVPTGTDSRFQKKIEDANMRFSFLEDGDTLSQYNLTDASSIYFDLRRIVEFESSKSNVLILPLGPKLFAALSMLVAISMHPKIMVWRHSTANPSRPSSISDASASGRIVKFPFDIVNELQV